MRSLMSAVLALTFTAAPAALSQPIADAKPVPGWLAYMGMILLIILIAIGSFMSSRRGHQD